MTVESGAITGVGLDSTSSFVILEAQTATEASDVSCVCALVSPIPVLSCHLLSQEGNPCSAK